MSTDPFFFGYGSLVNRRTHDYAEAHPARITGWRRAWRHSPIRPVSFLTVLPAPDDYIDGLIAAVPGADWAALDHRERAYERRGVSHQVSHGAGRALNVALYAIPDGHHHPPSEDNPILMSYLGTVIQGFLAEFGEEGVRHFFDTTDGWQAPILDDRPAPVYPRSQPLSRDEELLVEDGLKTVDAAIIPL